MGELGVSTSDAVTMFLRQVVLQRGLPFPVRLPNAETMAAIREARDRPETLRAYGSVDAMMDEVWPE